VEIEQAFKELKVDLAIRPIYHQTDARIEAHIFVAFLAYCLQVTLKQRRLDAGCALTRPRPHLAIGSPPRRGISAASHVEDLALMVDGTPQIHPLTGDPHHHFIEVPAIARPRTAPS